MKFYDLDKIKQTADCRKVATQLLGLKLEGDRCAAFWRNGTNKKSVHVTKDGFYDHATKEGGSVIDLVMKCNAIDFHPAVELVGDFLSLEKERHLPDAPQRKVVAEYIYTDEFGNPIHKTVRYEPKDFIQMHFINNEWVSGLNGIKLVPYNLPKIKDESVILFHEGEKAAEAGQELGYPSTTIALGANNWRAEYLDYFIDKNIIIIADNDDAGKAHADRLCFELRKTVKAIKVIKVSDKPKGDCADFVEDGGTYEQLVNIIKNAPTVDLSQIQETKEIKIETAEAKAKQLNRTPFCNYFWETQNREDGGRKSVKAPRRVNDLIKELHLRLLGFPRIIGGELFDHDRKSGTIRIMRDAKSLFAWIAEKTQHNAKWRGGEGFIDQQQFFESILANGMVYNTISHVPEYPSKENTYYAHGTLPKPTEDAHYFNTFCKFFCPSCIADGVLLKTMIASLVYCRSGVTRPMWVIDTIQGAGQGTGKTTLAELCAMLMGNDSEGAGEPLWIDPLSTRSEQQLNQIVRRLLSGSARQKKVFLLDNIDTYFNSSALASFVTQGSFSGIAPYGRGEATRLNNLFFCATCNGGTFSKDLIHRSMFLHLDKPKTYVENWEIKVREYIKANRLQIIADIIHIFEKGVPDDFNVKPQTRFKMWEKEVLMPICENEAIYDYVLSVIKERQGQADGEAVEADIIREKFRSNLETLGVLPHKTFAWIQSAVLRRWAQEAIPGMGGRTGRNVSHILKNFHKTGSLPELSDYIEKYPTSRGSAVAPCRGMMWCPDGETPEKDEKVRIVKENGSNVEAW